MTSRRGGTELVMAKLKSSIENKNFYEAHQMYRTLYFRYLFLVLELILVREQHLTYCVQFLSHESELRFRMVLFVILRLDPPKIMDSDLESDSDFFAVGHLL